MEDLSPQALAEELGDRPVRSYPALLSTEADALAWARSGAPEGAVVVADYQASPRGRSGLAWQVGEPGRGLGFSLVLRPSLPPEREGWLYTVAVSGLADAVGGGDAGVVWPDEVVVDGKRAAAVGVQVGLGPQSTEWAVATFLAVDAEPPRAPLLAEIVGAVERRYAMPPEDVIADYRQRCVTLGRKVRALLLPMGPAGPKVEGLAVDTFDDGALLFETPSGARVAVRPQNLGKLEESL
ncbi:MAG: hypothetical protein M3N57_11975 [Actinomycetota bacterium]|nr:hypothetical protein [Actinomycetota bacterium]